MRVAVYTAIFGGKDSLAEPSGFQPDSGVDYWCFTDDFDLQSEVYRIVGTKPKYRDLAKNARRFKILGFPEMEHYDVVVWHDSSFTFRHDMINDLVSSASGSMLATFRHPERDCGYNEALACIGYKKEYSFRLAVQVIGMFLRGYPARAGLYETSIIVFNPKLYCKSAVQKTWWWWVRHLSRRDQVSLSYALWRDKASASIISGSMFNNKYGHFKGHLVHSYKGPLVLGWLDKGWIKKVSWFIIYRLKLIREAGKKMPE